MTHSLLGKIADLQVNFNLFFIEGTSEEMERFLYALNEIMEMWQVANQRVEVQLLHLFLYVYIYLEQ